MPQIGIPRVRRHTFTPSPPSTELFALVTKLSERVGSKRAEFLIERLLDDHNAVVVSGDELVWAWYTAHQLAAVNFQREAKWFYRVAVSCAQAVHDVAMSTGEAETTTPNVGPRLTVVREAIQNLDQARHATAQRRAARSTQTKNQRLARLDRLVAAVEREHEIAPLKAIRRLFDRGVLDDSWLRANAKDANPKEWKTLRPNERRAKAQKLSRNLTTYRRKKRRGSKPTQ